MLIYHITARQEWLNQKPLGFYTPSGYAQDGFIHCSTSAQIWQVANRYYFNQRDLVVLEIDSTRLNTKVIFENLEGGADLFPHLYAKLPVDAVTREITLFVGDESV